MNGTKLLSFEFFPNFQDKEAFYQKLLQEESSKKKVLNLYFLMSLFSFLYGIVMGSYHSFYQAITAGIKLPVLFTLALLICFPAFFIIQFIIGSKLRLEQMVAIILSGFTLTSAIMVSFSPIVIFFLLTGSNYYFLQLLHISIVLLSGFFGMKTIIDALKFSCEEKGVYPKIGVEVFRFWIIIFAFVGIQLAWNLRPFLGDSGQPYKLFRKYEGNFYTALVYSFRQLAASENNGMVQKQRQRHSKTYIPADSLFVPNDKARK